MSLATPEQQKAFYETEFNVKLTGSMLIELIWHSQQRRAKTCKNIGKSGRRGELPYSIGETHKRPSQLGKDGSQRQDGYARHLRAVDS